MDRWGMLLLVMAYELAIKPVRWIRGLVSWWW